MRQRSRERVLRILQRQGDGDVAYDALGDASVLDAIGETPIPEDWREYFRTGDVRYVSLEPPSGDRAVFGAYLPDLPPDAELSCWGVGRIALTSAEGYHAGHKYWHPLAGVDTVSGL